MKLLRLILIALCGPGILSASDLKVAALHPLLADLAKQGGGERVEVIDLIGANGDAHHFEPSAEDLKRAADAMIYLAAGLGLEPYLSSMKSVVGHDVRILEVGATLPVLHGGCSDPDHPHEDHETDPHWWHSIDRFKRAATLVAEAFATADAAGAETYRTRAALYRDRLDGLETWSRTQLAAIPKAKRQLATTHAAFNYFCADFGFTAFPIQGVNREQSPDPAELASLIRELKAKHVMAIFPEKETNPKLLSVLTRDTGIKLGGALIADGTSSVSYETMVRANVETIVAGLSR